MKIFYTSVTIFFILSLKIFAGEVKVFGGTPSLIKNFKKINDKIFLTFDERFITLLED